RIVYDENGAERRIEKINANLSLPHIADPLTAKGDFDWKGTRVGFDLKLATIAELHAQRSARLDLALDTRAIDANFAGTVATKPAFSAEGDLTAKSQSVPSLLAWMREQPPAETGVGSGDLSSHVTWHPGEITFTQGRFALSHAAGQGQAVVTLGSPKPHVRAALFRGLPARTPSLPGGGAKAPRRRGSEPAPPPGARTGAAVPPPSAGAKGDNESATPQGDAAANPAPAEATPKSDRG